MEQVRKKKPFHLCSLMYTARVETYMKKHLATTVSTTIV